MTGINENMLTAKEASQVLGLSYRTICEYCRNGTIPARKIGRTWYIKREDLSAYLEIGSLK